jgi:hypothetical protein
MHKSSKRKFLNHERLHQEKKKFLKKSKVYNQQSIGKRTKLKVSSSRNVNSKMLAEINNTQ